MTTYETVSGTAKATVTAPNEVEAVRVAIPLLFGVRCNDFLPGGPPGGWWVSLPGPGRDYYVRVHAT